MLMMLNVLILEEMVKKVSVWPKLGFAGLFAYIFGGLALYITNIFFHECYGIFSKQINSSKIQKYEEIYNKPYYSHLSIYSFGLLVGIILNSKTVKIKKTILISGWCVSIVLMSIVIFLPYPYINQIQPYQKDMMILQSVLPFLWALGIAWVCVMCTTGYGGIVNRFLALKPFVILNRIIVWIYMLHLLVILYVFGKARKAQMISDLNMVKVLKFLLV
ncbi:nose resistant to fluoxetine protein 6-like [Centruroides sculpturatus]|uniref:nose resistant to fluoxetine protein 6-like n=1 Tax=Centruroides sculpturatus TaxID=218467 RepID=UPI000C6F00F9|nr:nose resistant to fluoxetine protein 6-like [Centruroides sculpturatus]